MSQRLVDRILKNDYGYLDEQVYLDYLVLMIAKVADEGNVVIMGRGSQYILNDHPDAVHVLLIDDLENRIRFIMKNYDMSARRAEQWVAAEDRRRANLYGKLHKTDYDNPSLYHLVINRGKVPLEDAKGLILQMIPS